MVLVIASFLRPIDTQDYLKQADEARPWIVWGLSTALIGFVLGFFGRRWWRVTSITSAFLLLLWWFLIGGSIL
jgi:uncharacterized membrane protein YbjE (DUF340 family)